MLAVAKVSPGPGNETEIGTDRDRNGDVVSRLTRLFRKSVKVTDGFNSPNMMWASAPPTSRSARMTCRPRFASANARLADTTLLPTPPFPDATEMSVAMVSAVSLSMRGAR